MYNFLFQGHQRMIEDESGCLIMDGIHQKLQSIDSTISANTLGRIMKRLFPSMKRYADSKLNPVIYRGITYIT